MVQAVRQAAIPGWTVSDMIGSTVLNDPIVRRCAYPSWPTISGMVLRPGLDGHRAWKLSFSAFAVSRRTAIRPPPDCG